MDLTIIVPTLNRPTLPRAIASLLGQTLMPRILVVGDGCMPTIEGVEGIEGPKFGSAGLIRNWAMQFIETTWVGYLDDDDILYDLYVQNWLNEHYDCDVLVYRMNNYGCIIPNGNVVRHGNIGMNYACKTEVALKIPFVNEVQAGNEDFIFHNEAVTKYQYKWLDYLGYMVRPNG